jgi:hypothetical protein
MRASPRRLLFLLPPAGSIVALLGDSHSRCKNRDSHQEDSQRSKRARVITVSGNSLQRGRALWEAMGGKAAELASGRRQACSDDGAFAWESFGQNIQHAWREHAPISWKELQGMVEAGASCSDMLLLATDFELQMAAWKHPQRFWRNVHDHVDDEPPDQPPQHSVRGLRREAPGRCTAFAKYDACAGVALCGQNVDEDPSGWKGGTEDAVVRLLSDSPQVPHAMVFTHPGVPAYCGMNSEGLCVLNLYLPDEGGGGGDNDASIDEGVGDHDGAHDSSESQCSPLGSPGLPIDVIIRELLTFGTAQEAVAWLEAVPRASASTYLLLQGDRIVCVEASADTTASLWLRGRRIQFCHANHALLLDQTGGDDGDDGVGDGEAADADADTAAAPAAGTAEISGGGQAVHPEVANPSSTTERLRHIQRALNHCTTRRTARLRGVSDDSRHGSRNSGCDGDCNLNVNSAQKILEGTPPAHPTNAPTIARIVMDPERRTMHVCFCGESTWTEVSVPASDRTL